MADQRQIDPSVAQAAQIPLQSFTIPDFPPEASSLKALTLTSDIKLDEYSKILEQPATVSKLPKSIESLTLELFSLGYPPGFLNALSIQLPALKELLIYSQLFAGISEESRKDAEKFFENEKQLRALHLLDVFAKPGFFETVGKTLSSRGKDGILFLQVNYSFRHEDEAFLETVPAGELVHLIGPSLVTCAFNISLPDVTNDPDDPANLNREGAKQQRRHEGVMAINHSMSPYLVDALIKDETAPKELLLLNTTLYTLKLEGLSDILGRHTGLLVLHVTVDLEPTEQHKKAILAALSQCPKLEQVELVGNPSLQFYIAAAHRGGGALKSAFPTKQDMTTLEENCPKLESFKVNILRTSSLGSVEWLKEGGEWKGGITEAEVRPDPPSAAVTHGSAPVQAEVA